MKTLLALVLVVFSVSNAFGAAAPSWSRLARAAAKVSQIGDVPASMADDLLQYGCALAISDASPVRFFMLNGVTPFAIAPCVGSIPNGGTVAFVNQGGDPMIVSLPVPDLRGSFKATVRGFHEWLPERQRLAMHFPTDVCSSYKYRFIYWLDGSEFILESVERSVGGRCDPFPLWEHFYTQSDAFKSSASD